MTTAGQNDPSIVIEKVVDASGLTEGPHWDYNTQKLLFVDIWANKICSFDPATSKVVYAELAKPVGVVVPVENSSNLLLAGSGRDLVLVTWDCVNNVKNPPIKIVGSVEEDRQANRFNDGKCDPSGRFWAGTMCDNEGKFEKDQGAFYSLDSKLQVKLQFSSVSISNGLAWKDNKFYYIDTLTFQVSAFDYDAKNGTIANKKVAFDFKENNITGYPDGMTIDSDGNLWVAVWEGSRILQINPKSGKLLRTIYIPAKRVTSATFGGPSLEILYVTTAGYGFNNPKEKTPDDDKLGGSIFTVKGLGVKGLPANCFKMTV